MRKREPKCRPPRRDQVPTRAVSIGWIMTRPTFALGAADARAGRPYRADYDLWDTDGQWNYERGRCWARLAPRNLPLRRNGTLNPAAIDYYRDAIR